MMDLLGEEETTSKDAVMTPCSPTLITTAATDLRTQWYRGKKGKYQKVCVHILLTAHNSKPLQLE